MTITINNTITTTTPIEKTKETEGKHRGITAGFPADLGDKLTYLLLRRE